MLDHPIDHARVTRAVQASGHYFHFTRLTSPEEVDETLLAWLTESYATSER